jgi:Arc/MetJ-type ribon-helix-helix transcriptional regulator
MSDLVRAAVRAIQKEAEDLRERAADLMRHADAHR